MTDDLTETTDMSNDEVTADQVTTDEVTTDAAPNPIDLLPTGDTDVLADVADLDDESDTGSDVAEEVAAVHVESDETQAAEEDEAAAEGERRRRAGRARRADPTIPPHALASGTWSTRSPATRRRSPPTCRRASSR